MSDETETKTWDDGAAYYSTSADDERLVHEDIDDCICEYLESRPGAIIDAVAGGLTVHAWVRDEIDLETEAKDQLVSWVERMSEEILEEYGDPDGQSKDVFGAEAVEAFKTAVTPALKTLLSTVVPWQCSAIEERTFTADELLAWVREHEPKWLEGKS
jgi:hypothetical protein